MEADPQPLRQVVCKGPHVPIVLLPVLFNQCVCLPVRCVWSDSAVLYYICHPSFHLSQVLPWLLQTHCCLFFEKDPGKRRWVGVITQTQGRGHVSTLFFLFPLFFLRVV